MNEHAAAALLIEGAKGKGGRAPREAADSLRSTQTAEIVDLVSEGECGGLVNGLKSVFLDGVPVENANGSRNFEVGGFSVMLGAPNQQPMSGFNAVQAETAVGLQVDNGSPVVRTINNSAVDSVRVTISVPVLTELKTKNGDLVGSSFTWAIDVQSAGGGFVQRFTQEVKGKSTSGYARAVVLPLSSYGPAPWDVRVRRVSPNAPTANITNAFSWQSYTEIQSIRMRYTNSAVIGMRLDAKSFSAVPQRAYDWMGISDFEIPINYDPLARTTSGAWNGLFKLGWTNNPAWVLYNLVKNKRYGLGQYVSVAPDKWQLYQLAAWCDVFVPDGRGGTEPRYQINAYLQTAEEALTLLQGIASIFRGVVLYGAGSIGVTWDAPATPVAQYSPANVVAGSISYSDQSDKLVKTVCTCFYADQTQVGKRNSVTWEDAALIAKCGIREMEIEPLGCTTPGQALRLAKWALFSLAREGELVSFRAGGDGAVGRVGEVFQLTDPSEAGERLGGRIVAATTTQLTADAPVELAAGEAYVLWVTQPDPANPSRLLLEQRPVTNAAGTHSVLNVFPAFSAAPAAQTMWLLAGTNVQPTLWRYVSITEVVGGEGQLEYDIVGVTHDPNKWSEIEQGIVLAPRPTTRLGTAAPMPGALNVQETVYSTGNIKRSRVSVGWPVSVQGLQYVLQWRLNQGAWNVLPPQGANGADIDMLAPGELDIEVRSLNGPNASLPRTATITVLGAGQLAGTFRAVARGGGDTQSPSPAGLFDANGTSISGAGRSYVVNVIRRSDGVLLSGNVYDVYGTAGAAAAMAAALNALGSDVVVVVRSEDEPQANRGDGGLAGAMYRCGASRAVFGSAQFRAFAAYVLIGIPGCGEGQGFEAYQGSVDGDTNAWCDASFMLAEGKLIVSGSSSTPRSLADYGYTGDLDATRGASAGVNLYDSNGRITSDHRLLGNLLDSSTWLLGSTGAQPGFSLNGPSSENSIIFESAPDNTYRNLWRCTSNDDTADADGGWNTASFAIDHTKQYRFSVWLRCVGTMDGNYYLGVGADTVNNIGGGLNSNPYFINGARGALVAGRWYLAVGYVQPSGYAGAQLNLGGLYDGVTGVRIAAGTDYRWALAQATSYHRAYQYYASPGAVQDFYDPRVDLCNGSEPSLSELLRIAGTDQIARGAATQVVYDQFDFGNVAYGYGSNGTVRSFDVTPTTDCEIEFTATLETTYVTGGYGVWWAWRDNVTITETVMGNAINSGAPSPPGAAQISSCAFSFSAIAGRTYSFRVKRAVGGSGTLLRLSFMRVTMIKR